MTYQVYDSDMDEQERKSLEIEIISLKKSFSANPEQEISKPNL